MHGTIDECMLDLFKQSNTELAHDLELSYNTISTWRFQFNKGGLSDKKKRAILTKTGYKLKTPEKWHRKVK